MARKKRKALPPRRKRMKRPARLQAARHWLAKGGHGPRIVRAYARWFGVDLGCALKELKMLGVAIDPVYAEQIMTTLRNRPPRRRARPLEDPGLYGYGVDWDDNYAFIAGFTSGGAPYGTTWEELERDEEEYGAPFDGHAVEFWDQWAYWTWRPAPVEESHHVVLAALQLFDPLEPPPDDVEPPRREDMTR